MPELIHYQIRDRVAVLTIDNPPVNAMGPGVLEGIGRGNDVTARLDPAPGYCCVRIATH